MLFALLTSPAAAQTVVQYGYLYYTYNSNNTALTLTGYEPTAPLGFLSIPSTINGLPVTGIGDNALSSCYGLSGVTIPASITHIGNTPFIACFNLISITVDAGNPFYSSVGGVLFNKNQTTLVAFPGIEGGSYTIPDGVTSIGDEAFNNCYGLTSISMPNSVTYLGFGAFSSCYSLAHVAISDNVTEIPHYAFYECTKLTSVAIPYGVTYIGEYAFTFCSSLTSVTIPNTVTYIVGNAFYACDGLTNIVIPNSVTNIEIETFAQCANLASVTIPDSVIEIWDEAFYDDSSLASVEIPASVTGIYPYAFDGCSRLRSIFFDGRPPLADPSVFDYDTNVIAYYVAGTPGWGSTFAGLPTAVWIEASFTYTAQNGAITITGYIGPGGAVAIPSTINGLPVTSIGAAAFAGDNVASITISGSVTNIGNDAFGGCSSLTNVTIPASVTSIGDATFEGCSSLTSITIPASVISIGDDAFAGCVNLTSVYFQGNVITPNLTVFSGDNKATVYYLPGSTGWGLTFDDLPTALWIQFTYTTESGAIAITGYTGSGGAVIIPGTINGVPVTSIGPLAFYNYSGLTGVTIPTTVTNIGTYAFAYCANLTSVTIPDSVTSIEDGAFEGCSGLISATIPASVTSIGDSVFKDCTDLSSLTISYGVTSIGDGEFYGCSNLTSVTIPDGVTSIGDSSFASTGLTNITIPASVTSIAEYAFSACSNLTGVYFQGNAPIANSTVFDGDFGSNGSVYYIQGNAGWGAAFGGFPTAVWIQYLQLTADPTNGVAPLTVQFTCPGMDNVGNAITNWNWSFGDGVTSSAQNPVHAYTNAGTFTPILSAIDSLGATVLVSGPSVTITLPTVHFTAIPTNGIAPVTVQLTCPSTDDGGNAITSWNWSFGDGATSTAQNPAHTYITPGTFSPSLTAINSQEVEVLGSGPSVTITLPGVQFAASPISGLAPLTVQFDCPGTDNVGNAITNWNWDFGDGDTSTEQNPAHTYITPGTFSPSFTAINSLAVDVLASGPVISALFNSGLVVNGDFGTADFTGWALSGDAGNTFVDDGSQSGVTPYSGTYEAALETSGSLGYLSQTLSTTAGASYLLSFWFANPYADPGKLLVSWNGNTLLNTSHLHANDWKNMQFVVSATGTSTLLQVGFEDDDDYFGLDDISVVPIQPGISSLRASGGNLVLNVTNGQAGTTYYLIMSTNLALPLSQWTPVATNVLSAAGNFTITASNTVTQGVTHQFYSLKAP